MSVGQLVPMGEEVRLTIEVADSDLRIHDDIFEFLKPRLAKMKTPRSIDYTEVMPRDPNGKLYKRKLRDPYWEGRERAI